MLEDNERKRLRRGFYEVYKGYRSERPNNKNPDVYYVYWLSNEWKAESPSGKVFVLGYPQGMPDSSRMPEGKMDVSGLTRVSSREARRYIKNMNVHVDEVKQKISLLEKNLG